MQPDSITPAAARITNLNLSDDIMLVQSKCSPNQGVRPRLRLRRRQLRPKRRDSVNHVIVSIEQSHYGRNRPEFQSLDVVPAMRQPPVTFLPQVLGFRAHFWAEGYLLSNRCRAVAIALPQIPGGGHQALARIELSPVG
jgi:hypothetical protein